MGIIKMDDNEDNSIPEGFVKDTVNPEMPPSIPESTHQSNPVQTDLSMAEQTVQRLKQNSKAKYDNTPDNPIDTAHLLLQSSPTSELMLEIDTEFRLANLDSQEKYAIYQFTGLWNDFMWLRQTQQKKLIEAQVLYGKLYDAQNNDTLHHEIIFNQQQEEPNFFDKIGTYKKSRFIATLSRGKFGFERVSQIKTIAEYKMESNEKSDTSPSFMQKHFGGFKK